MFPREHARTEREGPDIALNNAIARARFETNPDSCAVSTGERQFLSQLRVAAMDSLEKYLPDSNLKLATFLAGYTEFKADSDPNNTLQSLASRLGVPEVGLKNAFEAYASLSSIILGEDQ